MCLYCDHWALHQQDWRRYLSCNNLLTCSDAAATLHTDRHAGWTDSGSGLWIRIEQVPWFFHWSHSEVKEYSAVLKIHVGLGIHVHSKSHSSMKQPHGYIRGPICIRFTWQFTEAHSRSGILIGCIRADGARWLEEESQCERLMTGMFSCWSSNLLQWPVEQVTVRSVCRQAD